jgi:hypothetical protein
VLVGCGTGAGHPAHDLERSFALDWHDRASSIAVSYRTTLISFHDGRWSARITVRNGSDTPLYETDWAPPGDLGTTWNGPALVYPGLDVLGNRRLIYLAADSEEPALPYPLRAGATWSGTIGGKLPEEPRVTRARPIWLRYPTFGIGRPWDNFSPALAVEWISNKAVQL